MQKERGELKIKNVRFGQQTPMEEKRKLLWKVFDLLLSDSKPLASGNNIKK